MKGIITTVRSTGTVAGNADTKIISTAMSDRQGLYIHNPNATYDLWWTHVAENAAAPTISSTDRDGVIGQDQTVFIPIAAGRLLYMRNSSGGATTSEYIVVETDEPFVGDHSKTEVAVTGTITVDSEFPAAAAITDDFANPTTTSVMAMGMWYDGSTWDRALGDSTDGLLVNLGANNDVTVPTDPFGVNADAASSTGSISAKLRRLATDLAAVISGSEMQADIVAALPAGTNAIGKLSANSGVDIGDVDVTSIAAGSNLVGDVAIQGRTTGGLSTFHDNDLDETKIAVKASAGTIYAIQAFNTTAAPLYLQLFDLATGSVTLGTTVPTNQFIIPGNADSDGAGFTCNIPQGIAYGTAITAACTTDNQGSTGAGANAANVEIHYK